MSYRRLPYRDLKGLPHEIFTVIFWLEWIYLGLNENRYWFLHFKEGSSILDCNFKYWWAFHTKPKRNREELTIESAILQFFFLLGKRSSEKRCKRCRYFSEILWISENDWQPIPWVSENVLQQHMHVFKTIVNPFVESPKGLVWSTPKLKIAAKNRRSFIKIVKPQAVHIQA
jgi:hypothetical protein